MHYWNAAPDNWVPGAEQYAKGWIECFHAYMGLGPAETHWPLQKFMKYSEEAVVHAGFEEGHAEVGSLQSTYLKSWYTTGCKPAEKTASIAGQSSDPRI